MGEWLDEVEYLEKICNSTADCQSCRLGYCIDSRKRGITNLDEANNASDNDKND